MFPELEKLKNLSLWLTTLESIRTCTIIWEHLDNNWDNLSPEHRPEARKQIDGIRNMIGNALLIAMGNISFERVSWDW